MRSRLLAVIANVFVVTISVLLALFAAEGALMVLDLPIAARPRIAHPPNFREPRRNIEFSFQFETNEYGLASPAISRAKDADSRRVLVLGDSFVEGFSVPQASTFSQKLTDRFSVRKPRADFINAGISGAGPVKYASLYYGLARRLKADAVLVCITYNDVSDTPEQLPAGLVEGRIPEADPLKGKTWYALPRIRLLLPRISDTKPPANVDWANFIERVVEQARSQGIASSEIAAWQNRIPKRLVDATRRGEFNGYLLSSALLSPSYLVDSMDLTGSGATRYAQMELLLAAMQRDAQSAGIEFGVVYIPSYYQYYPSSHSFDNPWVGAGMRVNKAWLESDTLLQSRLKAWTASQRIPYLDLTPAFKDRAQTDPVLNFPLDAHWTERGHELAADSLMKWMAESKGFPRVLGAR